MLNIGYILYKLKKIKKKYISRYLNKKYADKMMFFGDESIFYGFSDIKGFKDISIGYNVKVGDNCIIRGEGGLEIGDNFRSAKNLTIYTQNHNYEGGKLPYDYDYNYRKVIIGANVWIGINVTILPGTIIEDGVIIGAGTVVYGVVKKHSIIGASTFNKIKLRDSNHYEKLVKEGAYNLK